MDTHREACEIQMEQGCNNIRESMAKLESTIRARLQALNEEIDDILRSVEAECDDDIDPSEPDDSDSESSGKIEFLSHLCLFFHKRSNSDIWSSFRDRVIKGGFKSSFIKRILLPLILIRMK